MIYALLDKSDVIQPNHLESALAFWRYCEKSAQFISAPQEAFPVYFGQQCYREL